MLIHPKVAIDEGWVNEIPDDHISNVGVVFTMEHLVLLLNNSFHVSNEGFRPRDMSHITPVPDRRNPGQEYWTLAPNKCFMGRSNITLNLPEDIAVTVYALQEFIENGVSIPPTVMPGGYRGVFDYVILNNFGQTIIATGTTIGTIVFQDVRTERFACTFS